MFKTSAVERRWNICLSWSAVERRQLHSIVGKRTGTTVRRRRAQHQLTWRLSYDCRQQAAFTDAPWRCYYASMRFLKFRVTTGDGLATIVCASARSVTPHGGFTTLWHNSATFCCAPWRCSPIIGAQSRSTDLGGDLNLITYEYQWNLTRSCWDSSKLCIFRMHWLISNDLAHNQTVFNIYW